MIKNNNSICILFSFDFLNNIIFVYGVMHDANNCIKKKSIFLIIEKFN
jgi:hypothetical protein